MITTIITDRMVTTMFPQLHVPSLSGMYSHLLAHLVLTPPGFACVAGSAYLFGRQGLGEGNEYAGSVTGSRLVKQCRLTLIDHFLLSLAASAVMLHVAALGILWLGWHSSLFSALLLYLPLCCCGPYAVGLYLGLLNSDVMIAENRKPLDVVAE